MRIRVSFDISGTDELEKTIKTKMENTPNLNNNLLHSIGSMLNLCFQFKESDEAKIDRFSIGKVMDEEKKQ